MVGLRCKFLLLLQGLNHSSCWKSKQIWFSVQAKIEGLKERIKVGLGNVIFLCIFGCVSSSVHCINSMLFLYVEKKSRILGFKRLMFQLLSWRSFC